MKKFIKFTNIQERGNKMKKFIRLTAILGKHGEEEEVQAIFYTHYLRYVQVMDGYTQIWFDGGSGVERMRVKESLDEIWVRLNV